MVLVVIYVTIGAISFEMKSRHLGRSIFSVPFDKETVKYVLHGHRLSAGCRSSTNGSRITRGLRGDVHSSWFTRSTRRAVCTDRSGPRRCVTILDRNVTQWKQESLRNGNQKCSYTYCTYNAEGNILACIECPNLFFNSRRRRRFQQRT